MPCDPCSPLSRRQDQRQSTTGSAKRQRITHQDAPPKKVRSRFRYYRKHKCLTTSSRIERRLSATRRRHDLVRQPCLSWVSGQPRLIPSHLPEQKMGARPHHPYLLPFSSIGNRQAYALRPNLLLYRTARRNTSYSLAITARVGRSVPSRLLPSEILYQSYQENTKPEMQARGRRWD